MMKRVGRAKKTSTREPHCPIHHPYEDSGIKKSIPLAKFAPPNKLLTFHLFMIRI